MSSISIRAAIEYTSVLGMTWLGPLRLPRAYSIGRLQL